jgi:hypothetical protein
MKKKDIIIRLYKYHQIKEFQSLLDYEVTTKLKSYIK